MLRNFDELFSCWHLEEYQTNIPKFYILPVCPTIEIVRGPKILLTLSCSSFRRYNHYTSNVQDNVGILELALKLWSSCRSKLCRQETTVDNNGRDSYLLVILTTNMSLYYVDLPYFLLLVTIPESPEIMRCRRLESPTYNSAFLRTKHD